MVDVPRRLPPSPEERLKVNLDRMAPGSATGFTRSARPVNPLTGSQARLPQRPPAVGNYVPLGLSAGGGTIPAGAIPAGATAMVGAPYSLAFGDSASTGEGAIAAIALGQEAFTEGLRSVAIGWTASTGGSGLVGDYATAIGPGALAVFDGTTAIGLDANVSFAGDISIGTDSNTVQISTPLHATAGPTTGKYLPIRAGDGVIYLLPLYFLEEQL